MGTTEQPHIVLEMIVMTYFPSMSVPLVIDDAVRNIARNIVLDFAVATTSVSEVFKNL